MKRRRFTKAMLGALLVPELAKAEPPTSSRREELEGKLSDRYGPEVLEAVRTACAEAISECGTADLDETEQVAFEKCMAKFAELGVAFP